MITLENLIKKLTEFMETGFEGLKSLYRNKTTELLSKGEGKVVTVL
jgi:hypothetical protein